MKKLEPITMKVKDLKYALSELDGDEFIQILTEKGNIKQIVQVIRRKAGIVYLEIQPYERV